MVELTYQQIELGWSTIPALDRAFNILFEEVLRRRRKTEENHKNDIDI